MATSNPSLVIVWGEQGMYSNMVRRIYEFPKFWRETELWQTLGHYWLARCNNVSISYITWSLLISCDKIHVVLQPHSESWEGQFWCSSRLPNIHLIYPRRDKLEYSLIWITLHYPCNVTYVALLHRCLTWWPWQCRTFFIWFLFAL